jgi:hypothetical protein
VVENIEKPPELIHIIMAFVRANKETDGQMNDLHGPDPKFDEEKDEEISHAASSSEEEE